MKNILFLFFLFQSYLFAFAQNKHEIDSLQTVLQSTNDDTSKVVLLISLSKEYQGFNSSKAFEFGNKALSLSQNINFKKGIGNSHNNLGDIYWYNNDFASASDHYLKALNIFEQLNNKVEIASCFRNIGWVYYHQNNLEQALDYYSKSLEINLEMNHKIGLGHNYNDIAIIYIDQKEYSKAIENLNKSVAIEIELNSKGDLIANYNNLADAYANIGKIDLAIENIKKSIDIAKTDGNKQNLSLTYCNLGAYYTHEGKFDLALQSINNGLRYAKGIIKNITVTSDGLGNWFASFCAEQEQSILERNIGEIGVDLGVATCITTSDGRLIKKPEKIKGLSLIKKRTAKALSRKKKGSNRRQKTILVLRKIEAKIANIRKDFLQKTSTTLSKNHAVISVEDLKILNMSKSAKGTIEEPGKSVKVKSALNREILANGWGDFRNMLKYKQEYSGGRLVLVNPKNTSRMCSACGVIDKNSRVRQEWYACLHCGYKQHADMNATINILVAGRVALGDMDNVSCSA